MGRGSSEKAGLGDLRLRCFFLPYKNYDKFFGAFGPSVDIYAPTGSFANGRGSSSLILAPGATAGFMFADWIQSFLIVSYQYVSKQTTDLIPDDQKRARHGLSIQAILERDFGDSGSGGTMRVAELDTDSPERCGTLGAQLCGGWARIQFA